MDYLKLKETRLVHRENRLRRKYQLKELDHVDLDNYEDILRSKETRLQSREERLGIRDGY